MSFYDNWLTKQILAKDNFAKFYLNEKKCENLFLLFSRQ